METAILKETVKKSEIHAGNAFEYKWITYPESYLLEMEIEEDKEELTFAYHTEGRKPVLEIREEEILQCLLILENIGDLSCAREKYEFSIKPENLYYDEHATVKIKERDIKMDEVQLQEKEFIVEYKAVIGYSLQKKYSYDDFILGGADLLGKDGILGEINELQTVEEIQKTLLKEYHNIRVDRLKNKMLLSRKKYVTIKTVSIVLGVLLVGLAGFMGYHFFVTEPYKDASMKLNDAYMQSDYVICIDVMKKVSVEKLNVYQKYMLATAYVKSENLNTEQKENILSTLTFNDSTRKLEYWIYLGRGNTENAEDIALQLSDDQLLLYAYMKEKSKIEDDKELTGAEKSSKLDEITKKMQPLIEKYNTEDEQ